MQFSDIDKEDDYWEYSKPSGYNFEDDLEIGALPKRKNHSLITLTDSSNILTQQSSGSVKVANQENTYREIVKSLKLLGPNTENEIKNKNENKTDPNDVNSCIQRLMKGEDCSLNRFKSREAKLALLNSALNCFDGNVITSVLIFMEKTLCSRIFFQELILKPQAITHYINILQDTCRFKDLNDFLSMLGRCEEAAFLNYSQAIKHENLESKIKHLKHCDNNFFRDLSDKFFSKLIKEQIDLYERQLPIEWADSKELDGSKKLFEIPFPPFLGSSVISTFYYCIVNHYNWAENNLASPKSIQKFHSLNEKQILFTSLRALAQNQRWKEIDELFSYQSFLGTKKVKNIISFETVVKILFKAGSPPDMIKSYLKLIENNEVRFKLAEEIKLFEDLTSQ